MKRTLSKIGWLIGGVSLVLCCGAAELDIAKIDELTGLKGKLNAEEEVYKVSQPRTDLKISVDKWEMPPFMGLTSWAAFKEEMNDKVMVMGDLVLMQDVVNPAMSAALENGLEVTALHNHFFFDEPKVYFMHIGGEGDQAKLAHGVRTVLDKVKEVRAGQSKSAETFGGLKIPSKSSITAAPLQELLGNQGELNNG